MKKRILVLLFLIISSSAFAEINIQLFAAPYGPYQTKPGQVSGVFLSCIGANIEYEYNFPWFDISAGIGTRETNPYFQKLNLSAGIGKKISLGQNFELDLRCTGNVGLFSIPEKTWGINALVLFEQNQKSGFFGGLGAEVQFTPGYNWHGTSVFPNFPVYAGYKLKLF